MSCWPCSYYLHSRERFMKLYHCNLICTCVFQTSCRQAEVGRRRGLQYLHSGRCLSCWCSEGHHWQSRPAHAEIGEQDSIDRVLFRSYRGDQEHHRQQTHQGLYHFHYLQGSLCPPSVSISIPVCVCVCLSHFAIKSTAGNLLPYMSTLPDSAGVSRIFKNFLPKSRIDIFSRQERSFPRILRSPPGGKLHLTKLCFTPFPRLVKGSDRWSRLSKHASLTLINDCTIRLIVLINSTGLITLMN